MLEDSQTISKAASSQCIHEVAFTIISHLLSFKREVKSRPVICRKIANYNGSFIFKIRFTLHMSLS